ncbi:hypothetical protein PCANC_21107 [Puccinia coronata f. sp. avenae]|uniref:Uncharacterized protein n=1 Tax=Puccinia coronata f. sp. avenae TaxID=200324 RepID=A0A2N5TW00_9BASI|nr:hypothetical protein PCANC_21107 [Puccinia coronata f. sp. avenae]
MANLTRVHVAGAGTCLKFQTNWEPAPAPVQAGTRVQVADDQYMLVIELSELPELAAGLGELSKLNPKLACQELLGSRHLLAESSGKARSYLLSKGSQEVGSYLLAKSSGEAGSHLLAGGSREAGSYLHTEGSWEVGSHLLPRPLGKQVATCFQRPLGEQVATCSRDLLESRWLPAV